MATKKGLLTQAVASGVLTCAFLLTSIASGLGFALNGLQVQKLQKAFDANEMPSWEYYEKQRKLGDAKTFCVGTCALSFFAGTLAGIPDTKQRIKKYKEHEFDF